VIRQVARPGAPSGEAIRGHDRHGPSRARLERVAPAITVTMAAFFAGS